MTLLCELTDKYSKQPYFKALSRDTAKYIPLIFGHHLYKFLYEYLSKNDNNVTHIVIVKPDKASLEKLIASKLKHYSAKMADRDDRHFLRYWSQNIQLENEDLSEKVIDLIKKSRFMEKGLLQDEEYLLYLPLCGKSLNDLIQKDIGHKLTIYTNMGLAKLADEGIMQLDKSNAQSISKKLATLRKKSKIAFNKNYASAMNYTPRKYLDNFRDSFQKEIILHKQLKDKNEYFFYGSDDFTAKRGINEFLGSYNDKTELNLDYPPTQIDKEDNPFVFLNFHDFFGLEKQNNLSNLIRWENFPYDLIIQGNNDNRIDFFDNYRKITVPTENDIKGVISGLFISLLVSKGRYSGEKEDLYSFIEHKLLNNLLSNVSDPKALLLAVQDFWGISEDDLENSISFWSALLERYEEAVVKIQGKKRSPPQKEKWIIEITSQQYIVTSQKKSYNVPIEKSDFMVYLLLIIKHSQNNSTLMSIANLDIAAKEYKLGYINENSYYQSFRRAKKEHKWFNDFYERFMKNPSSKKEYGVLIDNVDISTLGFDELKLFLENPQG